MGHGGGHRSRQRPGRLLDHRAGRGRLCRGRRTESLCLDRSGVGLGLDCRRRHRHGSGVRRPGGKAGRRVDGEQGGGFAGTVAQLESAGPLQRFLALNQGPAAEGPNHSGGKLHLVRPQGDRALPWTALVFGLWIPVLFLLGPQPVRGAAHARAQIAGGGQKGIVRGRPQVVVPFVVVVPGMLASISIRTTCAPRPSAAMPRAGRVANRQPQAVIPFTPSSLTVPRRDAAGAAHNARLTGACSPALARPPPRRS